MKASQCRVSCRRRITVTIQGVKAGKLQHKAAAQMTLGWESAEHTNTSRQTRLLRTQVTSWSGGEAQEQHAGVISSSKRNFLLKASLGEASVRKAVAL